MASSAGLGPYQVTQPRLPATDPFSGTQISGKSASPFDPTAAMMGAGTLGSFYSQNQQPFQSAGQALFAPQPQPQPQPSPLPFNTNTTPQQAGPSVGQPLQAPTGGSSVNPGDFLQALFGALPMGPLYSGGQAGIGAAALAKGIPALAQQAGSAVSNAGQSIQNTIHNTVGQTPNPFNGGQPIAGPPVGPGAGMQQNTPGSPAGLGTGTAASNPSNGKTGGYTPGQIAGSNRSTGGPMGGSQYGWDAYFSPDANNPQGAYQNIMLARGFNPLAGPVGRYAANDYERASMNYLANQILGGAPYGQDYDQAFNNSFATGGAPVSNPQALMSGLVALRQKMLDVTEGRANWANYSEFQRAQLATKLLDDPQALSALMASQMPRGLGGMNGLSNFMQTIGGLRQNAGAEPVDFISALAPSFGYQISNPSGGGVGTLNNIFGPR